MANKAVRSLENALPYDAFDNRAKVVNFGVLGNVAKFSSVTDGDSLKFVKNTYIGDGQYGLQLKFDTVFTVSFWAKLPEGSMGVSQASTNRFMIVLDEGTKIDYTISSVDNNWHHYSIVRDGSNTITMRIDGTTVGTTTSIESFDLTNNSYIYLGDRYNYHTGYDVIVDDMCIVEGVLWNNDFDTDLPIDYLDLSAFKQYLVIVVSSGEVYGYAQE